MARMKQPESATDRMSEVMEQISKGRRDSAVRQVNQRCRIEFPEGSASSLMRQSRPRKGRQAGFKKGSRSRKGLQADFIRRSHNGKGLQAGSKTPSGCRKGPQVAFKRTTTFAQGSASRFHRLISFAQGSPSKFKNRLTHRQGSASSSSKAGRASKGSASKFQHSVHDSRDRTRGHREIPLGNALAKKTSNHGNGTPMRRRGQTRTISPVFRRRTFDQARPCTK